MELCQTSLWTEDLSIEMGLQAVPLQLEHITTNRSRNHHSTHLGPHFQVLQFLGCSYISNFFSLTLLYAVFLYKKLQLFLDVKSASPKSQVPGKQPNLLINYDLLISQHRRHFLKPCNYFIPLHTFHKIFHTPTGDSQKFSYPFFIWSTIPK